MPDGSRYDEDFFLWTRNQAERLRAAGSARSNLELDWENLAEEIESMGNSDRRELRSRLGVIIQHLLKLRYSSAIEPTDGWRDTIRRERSDVRLILEDSPSLRPKIDEFAVHMFARSAESAAAALAAFDESIPVAVHDMTINQDIIAGVMTTEYFP